MNLYISASKVCLSVCPGYFFSGGGTCYVGLHVSDTTNEKLACDGGV